MAETKQRDAHSAHPFDARLAHELVLVVELLGEDPQQLSLVQLLEAADYLNRERLALDARDRQQLLDLLADARDALGAPSTWRPSSGW